MQEYVEAMHDEIVAIVRANEEKLYLLLLGCDV
jgi:hypothetical protein